MPGEEVRRWVQMEWQLIVALVIMVPIVLLPVAFVWYLNFGGIRAAVRSARRGKVADKEQSAAPEKVR
jgi:hypothetical protein